MLQSFRPRTDFSAIMGCSAEIVSFHQESYGQQFCVYEIAGQFFIGVFGNEQFGVRFSGPGKGSQSYALVGINGLDVVNGCVLTTDWQGKTLTSAVGLQEIRTWVQNPFPSQSPALVFDHEQFDIMSQLGGTNNQIIQIHFFISTSAAKVLSFSSGYENFRPQRQPPFGYQQSSMIEPIFFGGDQRGGAGVGAGRDIFQQASQHEDIFLPQHHCSASVQFLWWDDLKDLLRQNEVQPNASPQQPARQRIGLPLQKLRRVGDDQYIRTVA